ncbi:MAG: AAA family ATPase, partial [Desulfurococcales archaeon]|nr:AAA family ATPase [Desulfurococcales archaeon]
MRYTIERIELKNFLSHIDTTLPLGRGITVLVGDNGAGKSSIVDAIFIQLYQPQRSGEYPRGGIRNLVNRTSPTDHALIKLGLRSQSSTPTLLEITSKIPRQGSREARVLKVIGSQKKIIARRPTEARGVIA